MNPRFIGAQTVAIWIIAALLLPGTGPKVIALIMAILNTWATLAD